MSGISLFISHSSQANMSTATEEVKKKKKKTSDKIVSNDNSKGQYTKINNISSLPPVAPPIAPVVSTMPKINLSSSSATATKATAGATGTSSTTIKASTTVMTEDPFFSFRDRVRIEVENVQKKHKKVMKLMQTVDTSSSVEFKDSRRDLTKMVRSVDKDIKELSIAVETIEKNRLKYPHVKDADLTGRRNAVASMASEIDGIKKSMESGDVRRKLDDDSRGITIKKGDTSADLEAQNAMKQISKENNKFIKNQKQETMLMINQQDDQLESLGGAVDRLGDIGRNVNQELKEQDKMLDALDKDMDDASNRMAQVQEVLGKLLKTKDGCQIWSIVILVVVLLILVACVIWL